jgi:hypothetical protein
MPATFDEDDQIVTPAAGVANVTGTAGGTYTATEQAMINANAAAINAILAALRAANIIAED